MGGRLDALLALLRERLTPDASADDIIALLSSEGYDRRQIGEVLSVLFADRRRGGPEGPVIHANTTFRVLGPHERGRFAPEAWGHLLALTGAGVLSATELEHVIERALVQLEGRIALDDLRALLEGGGPDDTGPPPERPTVH